MLYIIYFIQKHEIFKENYCYNNILKRRVRERKKEREREEE